jgi:acetyltransferase
VAAVTPIDPRGTLNFVSAVVDISKKSKKPVVLFCPMSRLRPAEEEIFREANIPMLFDAAECTTALSGLVRFADRVGKTKKPLDKALYDVQVDVEKLKGYLKTAGPILSEYETKRLLSYYGVEVVREATAKSPEEAVRIASEIGYPVVLKIDSPDIMHKTEANAIKLGVCDHNQLVGAYEEIVHNAQEYNPRANIRGVLIQEMVQDGREVIVGLSRDPQFGPTVMFGLGGVFTEVVDDVSLRVIPIHRSDAEEMIREIKGFKILEAFRGRPKADIESLIMTLLTISKLAEDLGDIILEMDLNPLLVFDEGKGAKILDASAVLRS